MVFEVMGTTESPRLLAASDGLPPGETSVLEAARPTPVDTGCPGPADDACPPPALRRSLPDGVINQLLRSAVSLQAEGLLRTAGALAGVWGGVLDRTEWIERDARDLASLAAAATAAKVPLPAGVDAGAGDPDHPSSVVEGMLASHEALVRVLRQLASAGGDGSSRPWLSVIAGILARREEEMVLLRAVGAYGRLPSEESYVHGRPPRH